MKTEIGNAERMRELRTAISVLLPDADDPRITSELVVLMAELRRAEQAAGLRP